ncbi:MAG: DUF1232 domain-containing protein [Leptolyngbyaceae cyanobacterium CSU_1_3]|nr:DUF1232 domain-containing protein [Leptolyngbyaceae cyanobacterium CSU_1_3]
MKFFTQPLYTWLRSKFTPSFQNPKYRWLLILGSALYLFSPLNMLTDALPILGWIDDGLILTFLVAEVSQVLLEKLKTRKDQSVDAAIVS